MIAIIPKRRFWYVLSGIAALGGALTLLGWGLKPGIDFTGGSLLEIDYPGERPPMPELREKIQTAIDEVSLTVQPVGDHGVVIKFPHVTEAEHQQLIAALRQGHPDVVEQRFDSIGPTIGRELRQKTWWAVILAIVGMVAYISFAFRKVRRPVPSWQYGGIAIFALLHDMLITSGAFAVLGHFYGLEVNAPFVAAMLTVFGYSVNDTIVVFDRIRDNLLHHSTSNFAALVETSIRQTIVRSTNTSVGTLLSLLSILAFGGETIRDFALALIIGIVVGTYSSIFLASPLLVDVQRWRSRGR